MKKILTALIAGFIVVVGLGAALRAKMVDVQTDSITVYQGGTVDLQSGSVLNIRPGANMQVAGSIVSAQTHTFSGDDGTTFTLAVLVKP